MQIKRIINPSDFSLPKINENVVLFFNLNHFFMFRDFCAPTKVKSFGPSKKYNFEGHGKSYTAIGGAIGAPLAVITLENAIESGGKHFFTFGTAGWLPENKYRGLIIDHIYTACDQTGISKDYGYQSEIIAASNQINGGYQIVSSNSFYQLTEYKVRKYRDQDISLIDMEFAPLLAVALLNKVNINPLFIISDIVDKDFVWKNLVQTPPFLNALNEGFTHLIEML